MLRRTLRSGVALFAIGCAIAAAAIAGEGSTRLQPAEPGPARIVREPREGVISLQAASLRLIVAEAFDVHPLDVHFEGEGAAAIDPDALFEGRVEVPGGDLASARLALREAIARDLGLDLQLRKRLQPVHVLVQHEAWLTPSTQPRPLHRPLPGRLIERRQPIASLVRFLRWHSQAPILDETGLDGEYDFVLEWDRSAQPLSLWLALEDLGLQLDLDERELEQVTVRRAAPAAGGAP